jgi:hypothetical protein
MKQYLFLLPIIFFLIGCKASSPPFRPRGLASTAIWVGGSDGGAWMDCGLATKEPRNEYSCSLFHENGDLWSKGSFLLFRLNAEGKWTLTADPLSPAKFSDYIFYDGVRIQIDKIFRLEPDGWIDYPFSSGEGKRIRYEIGVEKEEVAYSK